MSHYAERDMTTARFQTSYCVRAGFAAALAGAWFLAATPQPAAAQGLALTAYKQAVAESVSEDEGLASFYRARGFEPVWTGTDAQSSARRAALLDALSQAEMHGLPVSRYDAAGLMAQMRSVRGDRARGQLEITLSETYLRYAHDLNGGVLDGRRVNSGTKRGPQRLPSEALLERLEQGDPQVVLKGLAPQGPEYTRLMRAKLTLEQEIARGGWGQAVTGDKFEPGQSGPAVVALRDRLAAMGYLARSASPRYDGALSDAVAQFQTDHGLKVDGIAGPSTLAEINVPAVDRLKSVIVAMERERWLNAPEGLGKRHVLVNVADFQTRIIDDGKTTFETRSVVGHRDADRQTPEFSDTMEHMVINPSWYVPRSIVVKEYLPMLRRNPGAVSHLEITDSRGRRVNRGRGFSQYTKANFPFSMRQPPGPRNALGQVKFMFPNKYNIYLHDTPAKHLFNETERAYSHGCVRLGDPKDFAYALLSLQTDDPQGLFERKLRTQSEARVNLEQPVPVHLIYRTAFTKAKGPVNFRKDIYGRDAKLWDALSAAGVALAAPRS